MSLPASLASTEAEESVLGSIMLDNGAFARAQPLDASQFADSRRATIYAEIVALQDAQCPADTITVHEQLQRAGLADDCGGMYYLNQLTQSVVSGMHVAAYAAIVRDKAERRAMLAEWDRGVARIREAASTEDARLQLREIAAAATAGAPIRSELAFEVLDLAELGAAPAVQRQWWWDGYLPPGHLTLFGAHGGTGKSMVALLLAACIAVGSNCLGRATRQARVLVFSGEDPKELLLRRLAWICRLLRFDVDEVRANLRIIDATDFEPALFVERRIDGARTGVTTRTYQELAEYVEQEQIDVVIVDNASDTFDGDEINRAMVRAFIRSLVRLVRPRDGAVLLLAHVDKGTSRAAKAQTNTESYSGSTAWHNSARSRLFLLEKGPGELELQHQKCNLGPKQASLLLEWPEDGLPQVIRVASGPMQNYLDGNDTRTLLSLIHEFYGRGELVSTAQQSRHHAVSLLSNEKTYPNRKPAEVFGLLRDAERAQLIEREAYKDVNRKHKECWKLTAEGSAYLGTAPCAPCVPSDDVGTLSTDGANKARHVRHVHSRGYGGRSAHFQDSTEEFQPCAT